MMENDYLICIGGGLIWLIKAMWNYNVSFDGDRSLRFWPWPLAGDIWCAARLVLSACKPPSRGFENISKLKLKLITFNIALHSNAWHFQERLTVRK